MKLKRLKALLPMLWKPASFFLIVMAFGFQQLSAQETTAFGFGYNFLKNKPAFDFQFNRKSVSDAEDSYDLKFINGHFTLNPAIEAHIGPGTETSENNLLVNLNTYVKRDIGKVKNYVNFLKLNLLSPHASADKNFEVYQVFGTLGFDLASFNINRQKGKNIEFGIGVDYDFGLSSVDSTKMTENVSRLKVRPSLEWRFGAKRADPNLPPELEKDYFYRFKLSVSYIYYNFFEQDERVVQDKQFGFIKAAFDWRTSKTVKLIVAYKQGMTEPLYKQVDVLSFGIALTK